MLGDGNRDEGPPRAAEVSPLSPDEGLGILSQVLSLIGCICLLPAESGSPTRA